MDLYSYDVAYHHKATAGKARFQRLLPDFCLAPQKWLNLFKYEGFLGQMTLPLILIKTVEDIGAEH